MASSFGPRLYRRFAQVVGSPTPWVFILGVLAVNFIGEGLSMVIAASVDGTGWASGAWVTAAGFLMLVLVLLTFDLPKILKGVLRRNPPNVTHRPNILPRCGLIALVSTGQNLTAAEEAANYHLSATGDTLKYCWLLAGPGNGETSSWQNAQRIQADLQNKGVTTAVWQLKDADDVAEVFQIASQIYQEAQLRYNLNSEDLIADFTGGTKSMTAGLALACAAQNWDMQFMKPMKTDENGRAIPGSSVPCMVDVNFPGAHPKNDVQTPNTDRL